MKFSEIKKSYRPIFLFYLKVLHFEFHKNRSIGSGVISSNTLSALCSGHLCYKKMMYPLYARNLKKLCFWDVRVSVVYAVHPIFYNIFGNFQKFVFDLASLVSMIWFHQSASIYGPSEKQEFANFYNTWYFQCLNACI